MIRKTTDMKNQAIRSPLVMGLAGALLGTVAARMIRGATAKQRKERIEWQPAEGAGWPAGAEGGVADPGEYGSEGAGLGERVREGAAGLKDRAADLKDRAANLVDDVRERAADVRERAMQGVAEVRDRLPSADQVRGSAADAYRFATEEQPVLGGVLAMGVGMALGFLLPVTAREEQVIRPIRERAAENLGQLDDKVRQLADKLDEKIGHGAPEDAGGPVEGAAGVAGEGEAQQHPFGATQSRPFPTA